MNRTTSRTRKPSAHAEAPPAREAGQETDGGVQAVAFALHIMEYVAKRKGPVRVTDLAEAFNTNKNKIFRHLRTLMQQGYIVRDAATEQYQIGTRLVSLGLAVSQNFDLTRLANAAMESLRMQLGHSVVLSLVEDDGARVISVVRSESPIEIIVKPGSLLGFHASSQGKLILAFGPAGLLEKVCARELKPFTSKTLTSAAARIFVIARVSAAGWAVAPDEVAVGLNALAAPVFDATGALTATIAVVDLLQNIPATPAPEQVSRVMEAARDISRQLGYAGAWPPQIP